MKIAILFVCTFFIASYEVGAQDVGILRGSCLEQQGIDRSDLASIISDESEEGHRKRGCLELCYFERLGLMENQRLNMNTINNVIQKVMPPGEKTESMLKVLNDCSTTATNTGGEDPCIVADLFTTCGLAEFKLDIRALLPQMFA